MMTLGERVGAECSWHERESLDALPRAPRAAPGRVAPLPVPDPLDLASPGVLRYFAAEVLRHRVGEKATFWERMPPLTLAQEFALRMERPSTSFSMRMLAAAAERRRREHGAWDAAALRMYPRLWAATHASTLFVLDPRRVSRRAVSGLGATNPLRALLGWATPDTVLETHLLVAAARGVAASVARAAALRALEAAREAGWARVVGHVRIPPVLWRPDRAWCRANGVRPQAAPVDAVDHHAAAVEAAIRLAQHAAGNGSVRALRSAGELAAAARRRLRRTLRAGDRLPPVADVEAELSGDRRLTVEFVSRSYSTAALSAKLAALPGAIVVASSRTVAVRTASVTSGVCHHF